MKTIALNANPLSPVAGVVTHEQVMAQVDAEMAEEERINASLDRSIRELALAGDFNTFSDCFKDRHGWRPSRDLMEFEADLARGQVRLAFA